MESNFLHLQSQSPELAVVSTRWSFCDGGRRLPNLESFCNFEFFFTFLLTSTRLVWSPMTCPVKGSTGKGFLLLLTKVALSTSPTNPDGAAVGIFPDIGPAGATLAGVGGPKRLLNELLEDFVRLVVGFIAGCSSPSWNVEAILLSVLEKAKWGNDVHILSRNKITICQEISLVRIFLTCESSEATMVARLSRCYLGKDSLTRTI